MKNILFLPGDGIGPEIVKQVYKIVNWFNDNKGLDFKVDEALIGGAAYDETGNPLPEETMKKALNSDAILLGAVGGSKWESLDISVRPEKGLLGIRKSLDLFANFRPAIVFDELIHSSTLKEEVIKGLDIMIIRELTGGIYFGSPRGIKTLENSEQSGYNTLVYNTKEIRRIAKVAFDIARKRKCKLCSVDKANVLEATELWRKEVMKFGEENYPDVEVTNMYVDNASMQLIKDPKQFDVILSTNMFGDILSDCAAMLTGSLGMLPSASLSDIGKPALYEPVHGSAPDIANQDLANPMATILSFSMMLRYSFNMEEEALLVENAVKKVLAEGYRTQDIFEEGFIKTGTEAMGDHIVRALSQL